MPDNLNQLKNVKFQSNFKMNYCKYYENYFISFTFFVYRKRARSIKVSEVVQEQRILLEKKWSYFKQKQHLEDIQMLDRLIFSQQKALDELKNESEKLYQAAIQVQLS